MFRIHVLLSKYKDFNYLHSYGFYINYLIKTYLKGIYIISAKYEHIHQFVLLSNKEHRYRCYTMDSFLISSLSSNSNVHSSSKAIVSLKNIYTTH